MSSMNLLALVQRAYREAGYTGTPPASALNQTGRTADIVDYVLAAHEEIQLRRPDWNFDWAMASPTLSAGDDTYDPETDFGISLREFARKDYASYAYPTASGVNARSFMRFLPWEQFQGLQVPARSGSVPTHFTMRPDGDIQYYPVPGVPCTAVHEYWMASQVLATNTDVPRIPARFHMVIVWRAVMFAAEKVKDFGRYDTAEENFNRLMDSMSIECLPQMSVGSALA